MFSPLVYYQNRKSESLKIEILGAGGPFDSVKKNNIISVVLIVWILKKFFSIIWIKSSKEKDQILTDKIKFFYEYLYLFIGFKIE